MVVYSAANQCEKPTKIMYGSNISWKVLIREIPELTDRGFLEKLKDDKDGRTNALYAITRKGLLLLKFLDALYLFMEGKSPEISLPLPLLRTFFRAYNFGQDGMERFFEALGKKDVPWLEIPRLEDILQTPIPERKPLLQPIKDGRKEVEVEYVIVDDIMEGWAKCPECGRRIGERSIIAHIKRSHGKKARIVVENNT